MIIKNHFETNCHQDPSSASKEYDTLLRLVTVSTCHLRGARSSQGSPFGEFCFLASLSYPTRSNWTGNLDKVGHLWNNEIPSGYLTVRHGQWPIEIVDFPIKNGPWLPWLCLLVITRGSQSFRPSSIGDPLISTCLRSLNVDSELDPMCRFFFKKKVPPLVFWKFVYKSFQLHIQYQSYSRKPT
jgi:hypothetical protein